MRWEAIEVKMSCPQACDAFVCDDVCIECQFLERFFFISEMHRNLCARRFSSDRSVIIWAANAPMCSPHTCTLHTALHSTAKHTHTFISQFYIFCFQNCGATRAANSWTKYILFWCYANKNKNFFKTNYLNIFNQSWFFHLHFSGFLFSSLLYLPKIKFPAINLTL